MKLRVLQVITLSEWGGAQQVCYDLATNLDRETFTMEVACAPGGHLVERLEEAGIRVHRLSHMKRDLSPFSDLKCLIELYRLIRKGKYDIVHCHSTKAGFLGRMAAWMARVPRIYFTVHGWGFYNEQEYGWARRILVFAERICAKFSTFLVCVSQSDLDAGLKNRIAPLKKFRLIHNGVRVRETKKSQSLRQSLKMGPEEVVFIMVARLQYPKDPLLFLDAAAEVIGENDRCRFILVGDGPLYSRAEEFVRSRALEEKIHLIGFHDEPQALLEQCDVFVLTSHFEGLPITVLEAMGARLPVLATRVGGLDELVQDTKSGFLVPENDRQSLKEKMLILASNPSLRRSMGEAGACLFEEKFTLRQMLWKYEEFYQGAR